MKIKDTKIAEKMPNSFMYFKGAVLPTQHSINLLNTDIDANDICEVDEKKLEDIINTIYYHGQVVYQTYACTKKNKKYDINQLAKIIATSNCIKFRSKGE